eukprot:5006728-Pyramimonas_sp.AAC.1
MKSKWDLYRPLRVPRGPWPLPIGLVVCHFDYLRRRSCTALIEFPRRSAPPRPPFGAATVDG